MQPKSGADLTVRELVSRYLRHVKADNTLAPDALVHRARTLTDFVGRYGDVPVAELRPYHLTDWIADHDGWKSPATRKLRASEVKVVFQWAVNGERIKNNPFCRVHYRGAERRPELPDEILERLIAAANPCFQNVLRFLRLTGCRIGELCNARWADMNLERGLWTIPLHKGRRATGKPKILPLIGEAVNLLRRLAAECPIDATGTWRPTTPTEVGIVVVSVMSAKAHIFLNPRGTAYTTSVCRKYFARLKKRLGIKGFSCHCIRHAVASAAIRNGTPLKYVSLMLGHRSVGITLRYYDHVSTESDLEAVRAAAEAARPVFERNGKA